MKLDFSNITMDHLQNILFRPNPLKQQRVPDTKLNDYKRSPVRYYFLLM